jgi:aminodeoxyfutalosine deaminase
VSVTAHCAPVVLPIEAEPIRDGCVVVDGDRITGVGTRAELADRHPEARVRRWPGVLLPGLVNAHTHLQYTDFADLAATGWPFPRWIRELTARRATLTEPMWRESTRRGVHALLSSGTTAAADIVTDPVALLPTARAGLAGISYLEVVGADAEGWSRQLRQRLVTELDAAPAGRAIGISPHTLYTLGTGVFQDCVAIARERRIRIHPHLSETTAEVEYVATGTGPLADLTLTFELAMELVAAGGSGRTPAAQLEHMGGLGPDVHVAHGVHLGPDDRELLRRQGTSVALCVRSNEILGAGAPPVAEYLAEDSPIGLGTDSLASSPSLDVLAEAVACRLVARDQGYDGNDLDQRLVEAVTLGGATAMGMVDIGRLRHGCRADLTVFDVPVGGNPYSALLDHGPGRCVVTVLGGRIVHRRAG